MVKSVMKSSSARNRRADQDLARRLAEAQATVAALTAGQIDAVVASEGAVLLREAQAALSASEEKHRRMAESLHRSQRELGLIIERMPDGILLRRGDEILFANPALARILRYEQWELRHARLSALVHADDRAGMFPGPSAGPEAPVVEGEFRFLRKDGSQVILEVTPVEEVEFEGKPARLSVLRDLTEEKRMQERLMLSDRMASIGVIAAGVAHEINNPLAAVIANLDLVQREIERAPSWVFDQLGSLRDGLLDTREAAERVRNIVRDLKIFARAEVDRVASVDLHQVLDSTLRLAWNEIRHRARLVKDYGSVPPALGNESRLGQVFLNLLVNAAQSIPEGKVEHNEIALRTYQAGDGSAVVEIRDTGCGIPRETIKQIFTPFYTTKSPEVGTGLGLSITQSIVASFGGEISVESQLGRGTTFRVTLPPARERPTPPPETFASATISDGSGRVLIIDDDPQVRRAIRRILASEHQVVEASGPREALARLCTGERFDHVLCDLMMPEMTGMELLERLTVEFPDQAARVAFVTGGAFTPRARAFLGETAHRRIEKPFAPETLRSFVRSCIVRR